ncbi:MAG: cardiolipin synthase [Clostridia bacterium]|nr:cardiolipin synthase [Clostridia bacterium]
MRLWNKIFSRVTLVSLAILIQLVWLFVIVYYLSADYMIIGLIFSFFSLCAAIAIVNRPGNPWVKLAWIVPIMTFPLLGGLLYFLSGGTKPERSLRRALEESQKRLAPLNVGSADADSLPDSRIAGQCRYLGSRGFPLYGNTDAAYYADVRAGWERLLDDLRGAEKFIFMEYFIIHPGVMWDAVVEILTEKAAAGVDVRVMYDDFGSITSVPRKYNSQLEEKGIRCVAFNRYKPVYSVVMNHRDHRKITVVDGHVGWTGGANMADEYIKETVRFGDWKDNLVRMEGEGVRGLTLLFLQMWDAVLPGGASGDGNGAFMPDPVKAAAVRCPGYVLPYGDSPMDDEILAENVYLNIINQASEYVWIASPYVIVDYEMTRALCLAVRRGVDVRLVAPAIPDKKVVYRLTESHFPELLDNGVKVYTYTPGFVHSKCFLCDDRLAVIGTVNTDYRSLTLHFENACLFVDHPVLSSVRADFEDTFAVSALVSDRPRKAPLIRKFWMGILRLLAPLF